MPEWMTPHMKWINRLLWRILPETMVMQIPDNILESLAERRNYARSTHMRAYFWLKGWNMPEKSITWLFQRCENAEYYVKQYKEYNGKMMKKLVGQTRNFRYIERGQRDL